MKIPFKSAHSAAPYLVGFINIAIGLGLIYFNKPLDSPNKFPWLSTIGYILNQENFSILYQYFYALFSVFSGVLILTKLRLRTINEFNWTGFTYLAAIFFLFYALINFFVIRGYTVF